MNLWRPHKPCIYLLFFAALNLNYIIVSGSNNFQNKEQSYVLTHYSGQSKIPGQSIQAVFEDSKGLLWFGIESIGLSKYNGKNHIIYQNLPNDSTSLTNNFPLKITEDKQGYIWVATANGLNRLDRNTGYFTRFYHTTDTNSISSNVINDLTVDQHGFLWIATANGVNVFNPERNEFIRLLNNKKTELPSQDNHIHTIFIDPDNNVWVGSALNGLYLINHKSYQQFTKEWLLKPAKELTHHLTVINNWKSGQDMPRTGDIRDIYAHNSDTIWLSTQHGLFYYLRKKATFHRIRFKQQLNTNLNYCTYQSILIDSHNILWAGSTDNGLVIIDLNQSSINPILLRAEDNSRIHLKSNAIREIIESKSGLIWIATKFGGLHYFDRRQQTFPILTRGTETQPGLSDDYITSTIEDRYQNLWFGSKNGGLTCYSRKNGQFTYFKKNDTKNSLPSDRVECLAIDNNQTLWIGTERGLAAKQDGTTNFKHYLHMHVRNLFYLAPDHLWIGTTNGLYRFSISKGIIDPLPTQHNEFFDTQSNIGITRIIKDKGDVFWIGTSNNGLFEYHASQDRLIQHLHNNNDSNSISGNQVRALHIDTNGDLWIGTKSAGLNLYNRADNNFIHKLTPSTLPSFTIYQILEDDDGQLWLGTHDGITYFNPRNNYYHNYSISHGLQNNIFEINAHCKTHDGLLVMGGNSGVNIFEPEKISFASYIAPLVISNFSIFNIPRAIDIDSTKHFILSRHENYISFEFALLDYTSPDENRYQYILEPIDKNWIEAGNRNFASYTNLPPGDYSFKVRAINSGGIHNDKGIELTFHIPTSLWKKPWFLILLSILVIGIALGTYRLKINAGKRREAELRNLVQKRTQDLYAAYQKLMNFNKKIEQDNKKLMNQHDQITRQNQELEMHRHHLQELIKERTKDLEAEKIKAQESDRLKSAFLANMSHEIRTPLNAIMGFIDLLQTEMFDEKERHEINHIIHQNSQDLLQLINDIIDISIIESNQLVIKMADVHFNQFLKELYPTYLANKELKYKNIELICAPPDNSDDLIINTDSRRVRQIYINLINNSIKFTEKGYIKYGYEIDKNKGHLKCFVEDTGIGISKTNQQFLFKRFYKIEPQQDKIHRGTGLGLSISKHLCELMGGEIWVESEQNKGTTFYFTLPF
ncbi:ligand-binding sensor domain-containing protein [Geofilum sp. OHC36d9]|uniref:ligand-binding sensor domain-containing protein n=1 Tax=Geofilum sp. OHC36d9 TaxID=3458413 RepID=UPI004033E280